MLIMVGLGNPGAQYAGNRHNIGFMAVDEIARTGGFSPWSKKFHGEIAEGSIAGRKVILLKPLTFMNDSGRSVQAAAAFYKIPPADIVVFHDELDLPPGKVRVKTGGGHGGHNGLRSIDAHLGKEYRRVRLGIGHPGSKERVNPHVLGDFAKVDRDWLEPMLETVARNAPSLVAGEDAVFMNKVTLATGGSEEPAGAKGGAGKAKGESHVRQARPTETHAATGPMAGMLRRLLGGGDPN
ncbi:aminoacyl-tRNA hydrolase [Aureimonas phyllosphaerae]|uniref:Peptidyl-tRNA hydrolase n=1 Tax=Aureimonas phyllosphaerae TaxID=1166078 RepID=A0A7W6FU31_9HYPH|nr:aminoacyl-tRNA hydrolase [Aureimonas phyllosphaerae]MBB3935804.1 PTH1 family peptidyl-tRNA hydrolase [Aureimonas phyllosphaerae]MBB3959812.1 PTH1 family peptidyl-tRNA hydrolase [Aureimonas phyllosphaerae]SFF15299.1 peptidyl-tRNA hydrolase [Aureimonas phyllosphaerae]